MKQSQSAPGAVASVLSGTPVPVKKQPKRIGNQPSGANGGPAAADKLG